MATQREHGIAWTDATWNPIRGCSRVSEGCRNCYAEKVAYRFSGPGLPYEGLATTVNGHAAWTGEVRFIEKHLLDPLTDPDMRGPVIEHEAACKRSFDGGNEYCGCARPRRIFVNSMSDLFHPNVPDEWIDRIFAVMAMCPQHQFQVLTKRPERMSEYLGRACGRIADLVMKMRADRGDRGCVGPLPNVPPGATWWPLPNVWLGVSVENQAAADERIPLLLETPAAVRFISAEPLLGPVDISSNRIPVMWRAGLHWVIVGGESGSGARPMHPDWARSLRDQCQAAGVPFFFKQWGEYAPAVPSTAEARCGRIDHDGVEMVRVGKKAAGALLDGREWREFPESR